MTTPRLQLQRTCLPLFFAFSVLAACSESQRPDDELNPVKGTEIPRITPPKEALAGAHVPTLDPATMHEAEIGKVLEAGPRCDFRYTSTGKPVLAISMPPEGPASRAVVKLNGHLIVLEPAPNAAGGEGIKLISMVADPVRMTLMPDQRERTGGRDTVRRREADAVFEVGQSLRVGYRGYLDCTREPPTISPREVSGVR